jgi:hypothetical protein
MPHWKSVASPRKRGRPLTYEEKWRVYHAFESFERHKVEGSVIIVEDPYSVTSSYTGVARTTVANIVKSVRESRSVPQWVLSRYSPRYALSGIGNRRPHVSLASGQHE